VNASAGADVRSAEVASIDEGGARAHVDAADRKRANTRAHVDADDLEIPSTRAHVDADLVRSSNLRAHMDAGDMEIAHVGAGRIKIVSADAHVGVSSKLDAATLRTQAKTALTGLGWKPAIAHAAVTAAAAGAAPDVTLEQLIHASLRHGPVPKS
jgi:hypothetical protein